MRLINHLNESTIEDFDHFTELVERDCKPFLKDISKYNKLHSMLISGRKRDDGYFVGKVKKNRTPKDTPKEIHEWLDLIFKGNFGIKLRSQSLFVTGDISIASTYGRPYFIFPMGRYRLIWNDRIEDLYEYLKMNHVVTYHGINFDKFSDKDILETINEYEEVDDLSEFLTSGHEGMLVCDEYYAAEAKRATKQGIKYWLGINLRI